MPQNMRNLPGYKIKFSPATLENKLQTKYYEKNNCLIGRILGTFFTYNKSSIAKHSRFISSTSALTRRKHFL